MAEFSTDKTITLSPKTIADFQNKILTWYATNQRDLPWRKTRDPYAILVSEVMLQQTQVERVRQKYQHWMQLFPTFSILAESSKEKVLSAWSGLGYNRRALFLQRTATVIVQQFSSEMPHDENNLRSLPGVGEYTARALLCFAFHKQVTVIDTNVRKVIIHELLYGKEESKKRIEQIAQQILPKGKAYEWNQALMDYSSLVLKDKKIRVLRQSPFVGSRRYWRGYIMKILVQEKRMTLSTLYTNRLQGQGISYEAYTTIVESLLKDQLISVEKTTNELWI